MHSADKDQAVKPTATPINPLYALCITSLLVSTH